MVILSTVRSSLVESSPGFLDNPKRFNVACTRAKRLLVVVGDSRVLSAAGDCWRALLEHAYEGRSVVNGADVDLEEEDDEDRLWGGGEVDSDGEEGMERGFRSLKI